MFITLARRKPAGIACAAMHEEILLRVAGSYISRPLSNPGIAGIALNRHGSDDWRC